MPALLPRRNRCHKPGATVCVPIARCCRLRLKFPRRDVEVYAEGPDVRPRRLPVDPRGQDVDLRGRDFYPQGRDVDLRSLDFDPMGADFDCEGAEK
jgi:hypothetical protein